MRVMFLTAMFGLAVTGQSAGPAKAALPMALVEACVVGLTDLGARATWAGSATYRVESDANGVPSNLEFVQSTIAKFVRLDELEACLRRWRFDGKGSHVVTLQAATSGRFATAWEIAVTRGSRSFRLTLPHAK